MNVIKLLDSMALAVWELAEAETFERKAAAHRREAAALLGAAHAELQAGYKVATTAKGREFQVDTAKMLESLEKKANPQTTVGVL